MEGTAECGKGFAAGTGDFFVAGHTGCHDADGVVGAGVPVHRDAVVGSLHALPQGLVQHGRGDGAVGGDEAQHGSHVDVNHAGALGHGSQTDGSSADSGFQGI